MDQAKRLAQQTARVLGAVFCSLFMHRIGGDRDQKRLRADERKRNAAAMHRLKPSIAPAVRGNSVLLVNDVSTTGDTLEALTDLALSAGAIGVLWATIGQTVRRKVNGHAGRETAGTREFSRQKE